jgi:hypothetical protein
VGSHSKLLRAVGSPQEVIPGWVKRVRVVFVTRGQGSTALTYLLYAGIIQDLVFDPGRFHWTNNLGTLHSYSAKKGCTQILYPRVELKRLIPEKWPRLLPASYKPNWKEVWVIRRPQKEAAFLWSVYHRAIAVNQWRTQMFNGIPATCVYCPLQMSETVQHRVFECVRTNVIWNYAQLVIFTSQGTPSVNGFWLAFILQQCVFGSKLPRRVKTATAIWSLIRGTAIWITWLDRNAICFSNDFWPQAKIEKVLWEGILDHGHPAWYRTKLLMDQYPARSWKFLATFDQDWCGNDCFGVRRGALMSWNFTRPQMGSFN